MPTQYEVFEFNADSLTFQQWLMEKDEEGWEFVGVIYSASGPKWTFIKCVFKRKV